MSIAKCKCDQIIDTDDQLNYGSDGDCCCDNCFNILAEKFEQDLMPILLKIDINIDDADISSVVDMLLNEGYRKVR